MHFEYGAGFCASHPGAYTPPDSILRATRVLMPRHAHAPVNGSEHRSRFSMTAGACPTGDRDQYIKLSGVNQGLTCSMTAKTRRCELPVTKERVLVRRRLMLAVGVVASPGSMERRSWLRDALRRFDQPQVAQRFVIGCLGGDVAKLTEEIQQHGDIVVTGDPDSTPSACIEKSFAWWAFALVAFPRAAFIAKTDDDSLNNFGNLLDILTAPSISGGAGHSSSSVAEPQLLYAGWPQFTSFLPEFNIGCGWSGDSNGAIAATQVTRLGGVHTNCRFCVNHPFCYKHWLHPSSTGEPFNTTVRGPFVFATGALQVMSHALATRVFTSDVTRAFVRRTALARHERHPQWSGRSWDKPWWRRWECQAEDGTVGYAVFEAAQAHNLSVDFVSLAGLVGDAFDSVPQLDTQVTVHKLELNAEKLREAAAWEATLNGRRSRGNPSHRNDTYRQQRERYMNRLRPLLEELNASSRVVPPWQWRCHDVDSMRRREAEAAAAAEGGKGERRGRRGSRWVSDFVLRLPTAQQRWRLCVMSEADEQRFRQLTKRVNLWRRGDPRP